MNSWKLTTNFSLFLTKNVFCVRKTNVKRDKILHSEKDTFKEKLLVGHRCLVIFDFNNTKNALSFSKAESLLHTENAENLQGVNSWKLTSDFSLFLTKYIEGSNLRSSKTTNNINYISIDTNALENNFFLFSRSTTKNTAFPLANKSLTKTL